MKKYYQFNSTIITIAQNLTLSAEKNRLEPCVQRCQKIPLIWIILI